MRNREEKGSKNKRTRKDYHKDDTKEERNGKQKICNNGNEKEKQTRWRRKKSLRETKKLIKGIYA